MTDQANPAAAGDTGSRAEPSWDDFEVRLTAALLCVSYGDHATAKRVSRGRFTCRWTTSTW
jgi:hypothetical protein